jgi:uncharacterized protein (UPF0264 family)
MMSADNNSGSGFLRGAKNLAMTDLGGLFGDKKKSQPPVSSPVQSVPRLDSARVVSATTATSVTSVTPASFPKAAAKPSEDVVLVGSAKEMLALVLATPSAYTAFVGALDILVDVPMQDQARYSAAFAMLKKSNNYSMSEIVAGIEDHFKLLDAESEQKLKLIDDLDVEQNASAQVEVTSLDTAITQSMAEIERLRAVTAARIEDIKKEIEAKQVRSDTLTKDIKENRRQHALSKAQYETTVRSVRGALITEKNKIEKFLN